MKIRGAVALILISAALFAATILGQLQIDNRLERWIAPNSEEEARYEDFLATFGSDEFVLISVTSDELLHVDTLELLVDFVQQLEELPQVNRVEGLPQVYRQYFGAKDREGLMALVERVADRRDLGLSPDARTAGIKLLVAPAHDTEARKRLLESVRKPMSILEAEGLDTAWVGSPVLIDSLNRLSSTESIRSFAIALVASLLAMLALFRSIRSVAVAATAAAIPVVITLGLLHLSGRSLNMITSVLPALLWVLSLSGTIHLLVRYLEAGDDPSPEAAVAAVQRPASLASMTTALGFFSLLMADMPPVQELGFFAGVGILISLATTLTVAPFLIAVISPGWRGALRLPLLRLGFRWPTGVIVCTLLGIAVSASILPGLRVASNPLSFLPEDHPTVRDFEFIGEHLGGFYTLETVIDLPAPWTSSEVWPPLLELREALSASSIVTTVRTPLDLMMGWRELIGEGRSLPETRHEAEVLAEWLEGQDQVLFFSYVDPGGHRIRYSALVNEMNESLFLELVSRTRHALDDLPRGFDAHVTGQVLQLVTAQQTLISSQLRSLGLAFLVVFLTIGCGLASLRASLLSVLPNLLPLVAAFTSMVVFDLALDAGTVMVASIALGIAVDDTVHLLTEVHRRPKGETFEKGLADAVRRVEGAMVLTTVTACAGFFSLATSRFMPIRSFGLLAGIAMTVALLADLVVVPAILCLAQRKRESNGKPSRIAES